MNAQVKDINYGALSTYESPLYSASDIPQIVAFRDRVYFLARHDLDRQRGTFVTDGTETGTQPLERGLKSPLP